jgi:hypothetical protein
MVMSSSQLLSFLDHADYTRNGSVVPQTSDARAVQQEGIATPFRPAYVFCERGKIKMQVRQIRSIRFLGSTVFLALCGGLIAANSPEVPVVDGGLGSCRADFTVKDGSEKPIYNAKIHVILKYGFLSKRKTELEVGTNSDGKARVTGLPNLPKKPLEFTIKSGTVSTTVTDDPSDNCNATFNVTLKVE